MTEPMDSNRSHARAAILLSIRREHAERILRGSKRYELRKVVPSVPFRRVFLYETGGTGIIGCFDVGAVIKKRISELWRAVGNAATTHDRFLAYFKDFEEGYAIEVRSPLRFAAPLDAKTINGDFVRLIPPQSFAILEPGQPLYGVLESERLRALNTAPPIVKLNPIRASQHARYKKLVIKHISASYADIDETFPASALKVHALGYDPAGFFTVRKEVLEVFNNRQVPLGFTTLTYKSGGCVKTGPTILFPQFRGRGFGLATRRAIEERAVKTGSRKIYCTCPDTNDATIRYLLTSGMRIEAHLERHYATTHDELVFGKLLVADEPNGSTLPRCEGRNGRLVDPEGLNPKQLAADFKRMFELTWSPVTIQFAEALVRQAMKKEVAHAAKPKRLVCLTSGGHCVAAIVLLPKRGGAVKAMLLRSASGESSSGQLIEAAANVARNIGGRKIYFLHPVYDASVVRLLRHAGFQQEGLLRAPYRAGQDVVVMSRFL